MVVIPKQVKSKLKKPLGRVYRNADFAKKIRKKRLIVVGDESTLAVLGRGLVPHLAVFDFKIMRKKISKKQQKQLLSSFKKIKRYKNRKGTLSDYLLRNAKRLIREGGAILIDGEEDLTTLAFILSAGKNDVILYGQPNKGIVKILPDKKLKNRIKRMISSASALGHKI